MCNHIKSHLRTAGNGAGGKTNRWSPANISHPITVSLQLLILLPLPILLSAGRKYQSVTIRFKKKTKNKTRKCFRPQATLNHTLMQSFIVYTSSKKCIFLGFSQLG